MAFAHDVWHVNCNGRLYAGAEQFTFGFWLGQTDADAGVPTTDVANLIHERVKTFFGAATTLISWAAVLDTIKIQHWDASGALISGNTVFSNGIAAQPGGSQRNVVPQVALAVSFRGIVPRGPGANGRMFLPMVNNIPTVSGHMEQNDVNGILTNAVTMFNGIKADIPTYGNYLILASPGGVTPPSPPINVEVSNIRVGDVVDTIQRRRNGLRENFTAAALA